MVCQVLDEFGWDTEDMGRVEGAGAGSRGLLLWWLALGAALAPAGWCRLEEESIPSLAAAQALSASAAARYILDAWLRGGLSRAWQQKRKPLAGC